MTPAEPRAKKYRNVRKHLWRHGCGGVYYIYAPVSGLTKIGMTSDFNRRIQTLDSQTDGGVEEVGRLVITSEFHARAIEAMMHAIFADRAVGGEWFDLGIDGGDVADFDCPVYISDHFAASTENVLRSGIQPYPLARDETMESAAQRWGSITTRRLPGVPCQPARHTQARGGSTGAAEAATQRSLADLPSPVSDSAARLEHRMVPTGVRPLAPGRGQTGPSA